MQCSAVVACNTLKVDGMGRRMECGFRWESKPGETWPGGAPLSGLHVCRNILDDCVGLHLCYCGAENRETMDRLLRNPETLAALKRAEASIDEAVEMEIEEGQ